MYVHNAHNIFIFMLLLLLLLFAFVRFACMHYFVARPTRSRAETRDDDAPRYDTPPLTPPNDAPAPKWSDWFHVHDSLSLSRRFRDRHCLRVSPHGLCLCAFAKCVCNVVCKMHLWYAAPCCVTVPYMASAFSRSAGFALAQFDRLFSGVAGLRGCCVNSLCSCCLFAYSKKSIRLLITPLPARMSIFAAQRSVLLW